MRFLAWFGNEHLLTCFLILVEVSGIVRVVASVSSMRTCPRALIATSATVATMFYTLSIADTLFASVLCPYNRNNVPCGGISVVAAASAAERARARAHRHRHGSGPANTPHSIATTSKDIKVSRFRLLDANCFSSPLLFSTLACTLYNANNCGS